MEVKTCTAALRNLKSMEFNGSNSKLSIQYVDESVLVHTLFELKVYLSTKIMYT